MTAAPRSRHQVVVGNVFRILSALAVDLGLGKVFVGPITVRLHDGGVVEPDVIFVRADRLGIVDPESGVVGPPDVVVEAVSPSNREYDRGAEHKQYIEHGVAELWLVDADERTVGVWRRASEEPERVRDLLPWRVAGRRLEVPLAQVLAG